MPKSPKKLAGGKDRNEDSIHVALVGYGFAGKTFHAPLISAVPGFRLSCIGSRDPAKVKNDWPEAAVVGYDEVFRRPNIRLVVIATPNGTHYELAKAALNSGKHVVVDKPFTTTVAEAVDLIALAKSRGLLLSIFQSRRWDADFLTLRQIVASDCLGEITYFESRYDRFRPEVKRRWRELPGPAAGIWYDLGAHLADQALQLFGPPDSVFADLEMQRPGATTVDYFHVLLLYGRKRVILHGSSLVVANNPRFFIHGTEGSYTKDGLDIQESALKANQRPGGAGWGRDPVKGTLSLNAASGVCTVSVPNLPGNYLAYYERLYDAILGKGPNPVPAEESLQVMKVLELAVRSAEQGCELAWTTIG